MRLKDKVCIITGSAQGIGAAIARGYAGEGAKVVITDIDVQMEKARAMGKEVGSDLVLELDVRDRTTIRKAFQEIADFYGHINVLVNNAGINRTADFDKQTEEEWQDVIDVDLSGPFRCCQEVLPYITDHGRIINIGSLSGDTAGPRTPSYGCAKYGVIALSRNVARFLGPRHICVNTIAPGVIANEFTEITMAPEIKEWNRARLFIPRFASVEDMVGTAIFLASDESSYVTAQTISVNGGIWPG
jgi:3-oxoacyl-[acyl-carrier protein] reductase